MGVVIDLVVIEETIHGIDAVAAPLGFALWERERESADPVYLWYLAVAEEARVTLTASFPPSFFHPLFSTLFFLINRLLEKDAERIVPVLAERRNALKSHPLVQADGGVLMDTCFQTKQSNVMVSGIVRQMIQHQCAQTQPSK